MSAHQFTLEQLAALGALVVRTCEPGNHARFEVTKELAGAAMMVRIEYGLDAGTLVVGIEPDGYAHT